MAFFKFRKASAEQSAPAPVPESVEAMRKRARYRLAGAALLVLAGVVGFPILFDNQPRPIAVDIPIDIPDKAKVKPLALTPDAAAASSATGGAAGGAAAATDAAASRVAEGAVGGAEKNAASAAPAAKEAQKEEVILSASKAAPAMAEDKTKTETKSEAKPVVKAETKTETQAAPKADVATTDKAAVGRFVVQFGAFTDVTLAREARGKVERAGMKTYAQIAEIAGAKKIRVRVGPFENRGDAERAADKIKKLGLATAILEL